MLGHFNIEKPLIQAPMAGVTTPAFVIASCEAGVLGSIGAGYLNGEDTREFIQAVKKGTDQPFAVNLFIQQQPQIDIVVLQEARVALQPIYEQLQIEPVQTVVSKDVYHDQLQVVIDEKVPICSFTFGLPTAEDIAKLKEANIYLIGTATTVDEAIAVEKAGLDAVVIQGSEAGGHRGTFTEPLQLINLQTLLQEVKGKVEIPIIAAGGIMTAQDVETAMSLGACAVQVGTALLVANECEIPPLYKESILTAQPATTTLTKAFTGKYARGMKNDFTEQLRGAVIAPYPLQHHLTVAIRKESVKQQNPQFAAFWMGENSQHAKEGTINQIVNRLLST